MSVSAETKYGPIAKSWWPSTTSPITSSSDIGFKFVPNDRFNPNDIGKVIKILKPFRLSNSNDMQILIQWLPNTNVSVVCFDEIIYVIVDDDTAVEITKPKYTGL